MNTLYYSLDDAARMCGVGRDTVRRAINAGHLRAKRTGKAGGGKFLISVAALEKWFEELPDA